MNQNQFEILKTEFLLTQEQMNKYDQIGTSINTWTVSLWVAISGWGIQSGHKEMFLLSIILVSVFWFFESINKTFRQHYKKRRDEVAIVLEKVFKNENPDKEFSAPRLPLYSLKGMYKNMFMAHIATPYLVLMLISLVSYILL